MISIIISGEIKEKCPCFKCATLAARVKNSNFNPLLWKKIEDYISIYISSHTFDDIKKQPVINATRAAYKKFGKDPNRYRPSAEALCRRILRKLPLYRVNTLVDIINLVSIQTGYSIGGFDADKIQGNTLTLGLGKAGEPYEGIGKGELNIENLPVYRDNKGGIGTPTSDHERTKIDMETRNLLAIINGYDDGKYLEEAINYMQNLLKDFAYAEEIEICYF